MEEQVVVQETTVTTATNDDLLVQLKMTNEFLHYNLAIEGFFIAILIVIVFFVAKGSGTSA